MDANATELFAPQLLMLLNLVGGDQSHVKIVVDEVCTDLGLSTTRSNLGARPLYLDSGGPATSVLSEIAAEAYHVVQSQECGTLLDPAEEEEGQSGSLLEILLVGCITPERVGNLATAQAVYNKERIKMKVEKTEWRRSKKSNFRLDTLNAIGSDEHALKAFHLVLSRIECDWGVPVGWSRLRNALPLARFLKIFGMAEYHAKLASVGALSEVWARQAGSTKPRVLKLVSARVAERVRERADHLALGDPSTILRAQRWRFSEAQWASLRTPADQAIDAEPVPMEAE